VELAEPAAEVGAGDEAAPALADEGRTDQARRVLRRKAKEELLDEVVQQRHRRLGVVHAVVC
jgi:hypothetical protein